MAEKALRGDRPLLLIGLLAIALILSLTPYAANQLIRHPDERHYSDGAMGMIEGGNWLTPETGTGEIRVKKPPLTYWAEVAGMKVFGVGILGARAPWLLMAAINLFLVYALALTAGASKRTALLASAILGANICFLLSAMNAIPDQPLMLFLAVAAIGFTGLLFRDDRPNLFAWLAYGGTGLAILAKGLLPVAFLAYTLAFAFLDQRAAKRHRRLMNWPAIVGGLVLGGGWFAYQAINAPGELIGDFFDDQVSGKTRIDPIHMIRSALVSLASLTLPSAIFIATLGLAARTTSTRPTFGHFAGPARYLGFWIIATAGIFLFSGYLTYRYVLPVMPLAAVLIALLMASVDEGAVLRYVRPLFRIGLILTAFALAAILVVSTALLPLWQSAVLLAILAIVVLFLWRSTRLSNTPGMAIRMAALPYLAALIIFPVLYALAMPDIGSTLARSLKDRTLTPENALFVGRDTIAASVRLHLAEARPFAHIVHLSSTDDLSAYDTIITADETVAQSIAAGEFEIREVRAGWQEFTRTDLADALSAWDLRSAHERHGRPGFILTRKPPVADLPSEDVTVP